MTTHTKHTCGGPKFGRLTPGCPRCEELAAGAPARQGYGRSQAEQAQILRQALRTHDCTVTGCGPICTYGDW